jgi:hypothetical protein
VYGIVNEDNFKLTTFVNGVDRFNMKSVDIELFILLRRLLSIGTWIVVVFRTSGFNVSIGTVGAAIGAADAGSDTDVGPVTGTDDGDSIPSIVVSKKRE